MDLDKKQFTTSVLSAVTGCEPMTFRTWRNRNGLFPEAAGGRTWKRFSVLDLCVVRAIVVMTKQGVGAADAIWFVETQLVDALASLLQGKEIERYISFAQVGKFASTDEVVFIDSDGSQNFVDGKSLEPARISFQVLSAARSVADVLKECNGIVTIIDLLTVATHVVRGLGIGASSDQLGGED